MNDNFDIDTKLANFKRITETQDDGIALEYLERNNWDESVN